MSVKPPFRPFRYNEPRYLENQTSKLQKYFIRLILNFRSATFLKLMELLGPGGVLERFNYAKLPRTAQYEVIKEVLWVAYKDTWRREDSIPTEKPIKHDYRKTMKFAIKVRQNFSHLFPMACSVI